MITKILERFGNVIIALASAFSIIQFIIMVTNALAQAQKQQQG